MWLSSQRFSWNMWNIYSWPHVILICQPPICLDYRSAQTNPAPTQILLPKTLPIACCAKVLFLDSIKFRKWPKRKATFQYVVEGSSLSAGFHLPTWFRGAGVKFSLGKTMDWFIKGSDTDMYNTETPTFSTQAYFRKFLFKLRNF